VQSYKYLGTIIDSKLTFETNCEVVCKKKRASVPVLFEKTESVLLDKSIMTLFYHAFIESAMVWEPLFEK